MVAPNLLNRKFIAEAPNGVWLDDITHSATGEGGTDQGSNDAKHR
ncbi:hypothetical protein QE361_001272 [Sphingomonas sp. SORGH_AS802]|nr:hypothetical protein [Sphingomonas sp. SORGH_AS_0438]MDR6134297.1 hypothetical protein [Sphingomonas sp. SORGH_AS_0802]